MTFLRSVVGKLWFTIIFLVAFILFILTVMLLEFFENNTIIETKNDLTHQAEKIAKVLENHPGEQFSLGLEISWEIIDEVTNVVIIKNDQEVYFSPNSEKSVKLSVPDIRNDVELSKVFEENISVEKVSKLSSNQSEKDIAKYSIIGVPLHMDDRTKWCGIYLSILRDSPRNYTFNN